MGDSEVDGINMEADPKKRLNKNLQQIDFTD